MQSDAVLREIVGFRALGRYGELGVVVEVKDETGSGAQMIVVRGGVSDALIYFVPVARVHALSSENQTVRLDIDITDFVPHLHEDGTIELRAVSGPFG